ncbi:hypothetical protein EGN72_16190 [Pseudorhodobacter sp. E13]|nr:hypothetical protein EGN72_16190 [Pseudorhodobacter sp. E13]
MQMAEAVQQAHAQAARRDHKAENRWLKRIGAALSLKKVPCAKLSRKYHCATGAYGNVLLLNVRHEPDPTDVSGALSDQFR